MQNYNVLSNASTFFYQNHGYNPKYLAILFWTQHTWYGRGNSGSIPNIFANDVCILGYFMSILLFPTPPHHQYGKCSKYCWCILTICIYGRYLGVETMVQFLFLMLWQPISEWHFWAWKYDMLAEMQCLCSGGKNKVCMRDYDPWFLLKIVNYGRECVSIRE